MPLTTEDSVESNLSHCFLKARCEFATSGRISLGKSRSRWIYFSFTAMRGQTWRFQRNAGERMAAVCQDGTLLWRPHRAESARTFPRVLLVPARETGARAIEYSSSAYIDPSNDGCTRDNCDLSEIVRISRRNVIRDRSQRKSANLKDRCRINVQLVWSSTWIDLAVNFKVT
jgi:hypothetical protein